MIFVIGKVGNVMPVGINRMNNRLRYMEAQKKALELKKEKKKTILGRSFA